MAKDKKDKKELKHAKTNGHHRSHIEWHPDGSASVHHEHELGPEHDTRHAVGSHDGAMDSLMQHTSGPGPEELAAMAGGHGVPSEVAGKAGLPEDGGMSQAE